MIDRRLFVHIDWLTIALVAGLVLVGFATVYSATHVHMPSIYRKELYWIGIGAFFLLVAVVANYSLLERLAYPLYVFSLILLLMVILMGSSMGGAKRWISLGAFSIQPSEFAKLALIVALARYFSYEEVPPRGMALKDMALPGLILMAPFLLIAKQPDLGTAIILWMIFWSMVFIMKVRLRVLIGLGALLAAMVPTAWKMLKGYQKARLTSFLDPSTDPLGSGYHVLQSKIAVGSGGFLGKGFTAGTQGNLMFLPEHHTDFAFAVFAEEWGLMGSIVVLGLFLGLILSGLRTAEGAKDRFGFLLAFGITAMFFWHTVINLAMVSGMLPVVGVPLPFISYGGSFLVTAMIASGILINIYMRRFIF